jgi:hypothetical protein
LSCRGRPRNVLGRVGGTGAPQETLGWFGGPLGPPERRTPSRARHPTRDLSKKLTEGDQIHFTRWCFCAVGRQHGPHGAHSHTCTCADTCAHPQTCILASECCSNHDKQADFEPRSIRTDCATQTAINSGACTHHKSCDDLACTNYRRTIGLNSSTRAPHNTSNLLGKPTEIHPER